MAAGKNLRLSLDDRFNTDRNAAHCLMHSVIAGLELEYNHEVT